MTDLERAYGRLLAWYPRAFRREHGPEVLAVLMACARDGQRRPSLAESADVARSGLRMRLRSGVPRSARTVRAAIGLMYAGAAVSTGYLINSIYLTIALASIDDNKLHHVRLPELTGTGALQVPPLSAVGVALGIVGNVAVVAAWLGLARMAGRLRNWARIAAAALFGLATLETGLFIGGHRLLSLTLWVPGGPLVSLLTWPVAAAAVGLLWLPASGAYFRPPDLTPGLAPAQPPA